FRFHQQAQPPLNPRLFERRNHRNRVGGGDQDAEQQRRRPLPAGEPLHSNRSDACREQNAERGKQDDHKQVPAQFRPADREGGFKDERRQKGGEDQFFGKADFGERGEGQ